MSSEVAPALAVVDLEVKFGGLTAVDGVTAQIERGKVTSVIGPNGAGKTSLFNAITGVYPPTSGGVFVDGIAGFAPLTSSVIWRWVFIGLGSGLIATFLFHLVSLWKVVITDHYRYLQPFGWGEAVARVYTYFSHASLLQLAVPFLVGALGCGLAAAVTWSRGRRGAEILSGRGLARTFQHIRLFPGLTVRENVVMGMCRELTEAHAGVSLWLRALMKSRRLSAELGRAHLAAQELLKVVGLEAVGGQPVHELSYGAQRRVEIARALATRPKTVLLDEPAAGMNPTETTELMAIVQAIKARGITVVLIEHHMRVVMGVSDKIVVLHQGKVIATGTPVEIKNNPAVVDAYLGTARAGQGEL